MLIVPFSIFIVYNCVCFTAPSSFALLPPLSPVSRQRFDAEQMGPISPLLSTLRTLHQQFESYKQEVRRIGAETRRQQTQQKDDAPTCGICHKTKFANGCGHLCSYCQTKFCARCGGRVSLRSNNVRKLSRRCRSHADRAAHVVLLLPSCLLTVSFFCFSGHTLVNPKCVCV